MQTDISLQAYNTLAIPAKAQWFVELSNTDQFPEVSAFVSEQTCPVMVLGEGSNIVMAHDFAGLVILNRLMGKRVLEQDDDHVLIEVQAGENWHQIVKWTLDNGWYGLQNLALIPGTVGAAPIQNIGAYGVELHDVFVSLKAIEINTGNTHTFDKKQCEFAYRDSVFKHQWRDKLCITSVIFRLSKQAKSTSHYPALQQYFSAQNITTPTPQQVFDAVCAIRRSKLPDPQQLPNAGSFFKNPLVSQQHYQKLKTSYPDLVAYPAGEQMKLAAGWLIERAGWKGKQLGDIATHQQQALVITNPKQKSGQHILKYAQQLQTVIQQHFAVELEIEPRIYGL